MNRPLAAGVGTTGLGLVGFVLGIERAYPGRALSIPLVMVGITLVVFGIGRRWST